MAKKYTPKQLDNYLAKHGYRIMQEREYGYLPGEDMEYLNSNGTKKTVRITEINPNVR